MKKRLKRHTCCHCGAEIEQLLLVPVEVDVACWECSYGNGRGKLKHGVGVAGNGGEERMRSICELLRRQEVVA